MNPDDLRIQTTWRNSKECFSKAANLFSPAFEPIEIPYEGTTLTGYFYHMDNDKDNGSGKISRPTLIVHGGFDSTVKELHTSVYCSST